LGNLDKILKDEQKSLQLVEIMKKPQISRDELFKFLQNNEIPANEYTSERIVAERNGMIDELLEKRTQILKDLHPMIEEAKTTIRKQKESDVQNLTGQQERLVQEIALLPQGDEKKKIYEDQLTLLNSRIAFCNHLIDPKNDNIEIKHPDT
jgi:predicted DNA-binding transcriptional regulator AlpA